MTATTITLSATLAVSGDVRTGVTLTGLGTLDEDLELLHDGAVRFVENVLRTVPRGRVAASGFGPPARRRRRHHDHQQRDRSPAGTIDIFGDWTNGDPHFGTTIVLRGTITPGAARS